MKTTQCRNCGAEIGFIKTIAGKTMPVDTASRRFYRQEGGPELFVLVDGSTARGRSVEADIDGTEIGFISHFATCPNADDFRKPRKGDKRRNRRGDQ